MSDLQDLYQELILDHNRRPRNRRVMESADGHAEGYNPLCGDRVTVYIQLDGDRVRDVSFQGTGCAISTASASLMTEALKGKTVVEARALFDRFHELVTQGPNPNDGISLGKLRVFAGVNQYPARVKCATLAWHTLNAALEKQEGIVSTE